jgi:hypothetical protein
MSAAGYLKYGNVFLFCLSSRWRPFALCSDLGTVQVEQYGDRKKNNAEEAEQARRPWYTEFLVHCVCKQREKCTRK